MRHTFVQRIFAMLSLGMLLALVLPVTAATNAAGNTVLAPILVSPANNATGAAVPVALSWSAPDNDSYTYQVLVSRNDGFTDLAMAVKNLTIGKLSVPNLLPNMRYWWKVNGTKQNGDSAWSAVWSFTTTGAKPTPVAPAAPTLVAPPNNATGAPLVVSFSWTAVPGATSYSIQVGSTADFTTLIVSRDGLTTTSTQIGTTAAGAAAFKMSTKYAWRVKAVSAAGSSAWATAWAFTTVGAPPAPTLPGVPVLLTPANAATGVSIAPTLSWKPAERAATYAVQVAADPNFTTAVFAKDGLTATSAPIVGTTAGQNSVTSTLLTAGATYYWRVKAVNPAGSSAWSTVWSFTTVPPAPVLPGVPVLLTPANAATGVAVSPILTWKPAERAVTYSVQVAGDQNFTTNVFAQDGVAATLVQVGAATSDRGAAPSPVLKPGATYYWRVKAVSPAGSSAWSTVWSFTTQAPPAVPAAPVLVAPKNGAVLQRVTPGIPSAVVQPFTVTLSWLAAERAGTYNVQVATDEKCAVIVQGGTGITGTSLTIPPASNVVNAQTAENTRATTSTPAVPQLPAGKYYWRVSGVNAAGPGPWSDIWSFTVVVLNAP